MRTDPALTYSGALAILGEHEHVVLKTVNRILGGLILGSPAATVNLVNLLDPKNEASALIQQLLDGVADRLLGTAGHDRIQLISAAHSVLVVSSFFEAMRECVGPQNYARLKLSKTEKAALLSKENPARRTAESLLETLIKTEIPMPSARTGWHEHVQGELRPYILNAVSRTTGFLAGLEAWRTRPILSISHSQLMTNVTETTIRNYRGSYQRLAAAIPEFFVWASLGEHAATRREVSATNEWLASLLEGQSRALEKLQQILVNATHRVAARSHRSTLAAVNSAILDRSIVATDALRHVDDVSFPSARRGYVTPAFRLAFASKKALPSSESWWSHQAPREDLDEFLAAYLSSASSPRLPLLVLGHPGAGKSLLTKVLAARLPPTAFAVVRVPLRNVEAGVAVHRQVQQTLERETNGRISWQDLAEESRDVMRVVLLDGLDELIQATGVAQSDYLHLVAEFQQREFDLGSPVAVLVTSRTVVADRAQIPDGCLIVKLEDFDRRRIVEWLDVWAKTNKNGQDAGTFRPLKLESAVRHPELARQPLLLLMLALYAADPRLPDPGDE
jgi:hypothetical protein